MPILIPVCDRPHYLKRVFDGLNKVDGINEVKMIVIVQHILSKMRVGEGLLMKGRLRVRTLILSTASISTPPKFNSFIFIKNF